MLYYVLNITLLAGFLVSIIYGIIVLGKNKKIAQIFNVTLIAMIAFFVSRLFFIVLELANGDVNSFSVGVLGQVAAYLFLALANKTYLPFETEKQKFDFRAALILLFPLSIYVCCFVINNTFGEIICSILYCCSTCLTLYFSFKNLLSSKSNEDFKKLKAFFISVMIITFTSTLESLVLLISNSTMLTIACITLTVIAFVNSLIMLPLLHRGLRK